MEWANFVLSVGFVLARTVKIVLVAAFFIGRLDSPFLAPGVGKLGGLVLDNYPHVHLKAVLATEVRSSEGRRARFLGALFLTQPSLPRHDNRLIGTLIWSSWVCCT